MPSITVNGQKCDFEGKKNILQVALDNGVEIPHYCYHPGLSVVASCRICLAEVEAPNPRNDNKVELIPKLVPTCQTPAADGQVVHINTPKSVANQKSVMEYLLINHPLDCPVCDQAGECHLQDYSYDYGRGESRFEEAKIKQPTKDIGPNVKLYSDRCIMCSRCVRFTREVSGTSEIGVFGRGSSEQIDVFPGKPLDNELSGNVVDICPVGALLDKDFLFERRVWELKETPSIDGITASGDNISVHHADEKIYRVKPRANEEVNQWWISDEIRYGWKFVHSEDRMTAAYRDQMGDRGQCDLRKATLDLLKRLKDTKAEFGEGTLALVISPMLSNEEAYLLAKTFKAIDPQAKLAVGPIPVSGEDKTFPTGYKIHSEKCPNKLGVQRIIKAVTGEEAMSFEAFQEVLADKANAPKGLVVTGNYPSEWVTKEFAKAAGKVLLGMLDIFPSELSSKAKVFIPGATWLEKAGSFENADGRIQAFEKAIAVREGAVSEGDVASLWLRELGLFADELALGYDAAKVREIMAESGIEELNAFKDVTITVQEESKRSDITYVEI